MRTAIELPSEKTAAAVMRLDDIEDLVRLGESMLRACAIVGYTPAAAARQAWRCNRRELASRIAKAVTGE